MIDGNVSLKRVVCRAVVVIAIASSAACRADDGDVSGGSQIKDVETTGGKSQAGVVTPDQPAPSAVAVTPANAGEPVAIKVYKDANCGCCKKWVEHLASNGFKVETMDMPDLSLLKQKHGVADELQSCHTALVDGYVVEGHVPAEVVRRMLKERPQIAGLAVPGMPMGSPGMEGPTKERYDVLTFDRAGRTTVYSQQQ